MKVLVTGVKGQLGYDVVKELERRGHETVGVDVDEMDITDDGKVREVIGKVRPAAVVHCAAWTAVDKAEQCPEKVYEVNALGAKYIAEACKSVDAKMVFLSTDYVFEGVGETPYEVTDARKGLSVYGKTKIQGEDFVTEILDKYYIVRTTWVFGLNGGNFVKTMLRLADSGKTELSVVNDQIGSPTYTVDLARLIVDMIQTDKYGVYHATNDGFCSCYDFACEIFKQAGKQIKVNPVTTDEYLKMVPQQAKRPLNSRLSKKSLDCAGLKKLPAWQDALKRYLAELTND
ncbi:MAG: dTDP-4-dehydrorhamnose reductase [Clostridiales bacterium]|nr:dTDP-4-dehydrorhamnose reductase [Clostridiales bacterium]